MCSSPIELELRCAACGSIDAYAVTSIFMNPKRAGGKPFIGDELVCRSCGLLTDFVPTQAGMDRLVQAYLALLSSAQREGTTDGPIVFVNTTLTNGQIVAPGEAVEHLRKAVSQKTPRGADLFDLGCCYASMNRNKQASTYLRRCLAQEPTWVEAAVSLARILESQGKPRAAFAALARALNSSSRWRFRRLGTTAPADFGWMYAKLYNRLRLLAGCSDRPALHPCFVEARYRHVRRNSACPCGSGKKFGLCCGRPLKGVL